MTQVELLWVLGYYLKTLFIVRDCSNIMLIIGLQKLKNLYREYYVENKQKIYL